MNRFIFLLKKELFDIIGSKAFLIFLIITSSIPIFLKINDLQILELLCQILLIQRLCDKCKKELKNGTYLFYINTNISYKMLYFMQSIFCITMASIPLLINFKMLTNSDFKIFTLFILSMSFLYAFTSFFSYIFISNEFFAYLFSACTLPLIFFINQKLNFLLISTIYTICTFLFYFLSKKAYHSKRFRILC